MEKKWILLKNILSACITRVHCTHHATDNCAHPTKRQKNKKSKEKPGWQGNFFESSMLSFHSIVEFHSGAWKFVRWLVSQSPSTSVHHFCVCLICIWFDFQAEQFYHTERKQADFGKIWFKLKLICISQLLRWIFLNICMLLETLRSQYYLPNTFKWFQVFYISLLEEEQKEKADVRKIWLKLILWTLLTLKMKLTEYFSVTGIA